MPREAHVRTLIVALAIVLVGAHSPTFALAAPPSFGSGQTVAASADGATGQGVQKKSKKKKDKVTVGFDEIKSVKKGKIDFEIVARVSNHKSNEDYICELVITYVDGTREEADIADVDRDGVCISVIDVLDEGEVVGKATAHVVVRGEDGKKKGSDRTTFNVRAGRAG